MRGVSPCACDPLCVTTTDAAMLLGTGPSGVFNGYLKTVVDPETGKLVGLFLGTDDDRTGKGLRIGDGYHN